MVQKFVGIALHFTPSAGSGIVIKTNRSVGLSFCFPLSFLRMCAISLYTCQCQPSSHRLPHSWKKHTIFGKFTENSKEWEASQMLRSNEQTHNNIGMPKDSAAFWPKGLTTKFGADLLMQKANGHECLLQSYRNQVRNILFHRWALYAWIIHSKSAKKMLGCTLGKSASMCGTAD